MEFFYVQQSMTLKLPHKECVLHAPEGQMLSTKQIPLRYIYCGNVYWEAKHAQSVAGDEAVVAFPGTEELLRHLPPRLRPWSCGQGLIEQVRDIMAGRSADKHGQPLRLALINGVGTMIGDTLVGSTAVEVAVRRLKEAFGIVEVHAALGWNARSGTEEIFQRSPAIAAIHHHAITVEQLRSCDAYWDFSELLSLDGYDTLPLIDFYLDALGIDPKSTPASEKVPSLRIPTAVVDETATMLRPHRGRPLLLIQGRASTPLRSMPDFFLVDLISEVLSRTRATVVIAQPLPEAINIKEDERLLTLANWCEGSTDRYLALVAAMDALVSIDSLAVHVAAAANIPGVAIFTTLDPSLRITYAPALKGMLIPDATQLSTWGKHKADSNWPSEQAEYDRAWARIDKGEILENPFLEGGHAPVRTSHPIVGNLQEIGPSPGSPNGDQRTPIHQSRGHSMTQQKQVLHVGCGSYDPRKLPAFFRTEDWKELRLDIDPRAQPDIVADMLDLSQLVDGQVDAIYSSHNVEHLYPHEVPVALKEFRRVIKPGGLALITLPDLQEVARLVAEGRLDEPAYISPSGPIAPHDILYGHRPSMANGNLFMAHRTGFTAKTLAQALVNAGFVMVSIQRNPALFNLWAIAFVTKPTDEELKIAQAQMFPLPVQQPKAG